MHRIDRIAPHRRKPEATFAIYSGARAENHAMNAGRRTIVIVGGGLGGLTLANLLRQCRDAFDVNLFERDASANARAQGYNISLKDPGGLVPLRRLDLYDEVREYSRIVET